MGFQLPQIPHQDGHQKFFSWVQMLLFLGLLIALIYAVFHLTANWFLRILGIVAAYAVTALFTYLVLRPLCMYIEAWIRRRKSR